MQDKREILRWPVITGETDPILVELSSGSELILLERMPDFESTSMMTENQAIVKHKLFTREAYIADCAEVVTIMEEDINIHSYCVSISKTPEGAMFQRSVKVTFKYVENN